MKKKFVLGASIGNCVHVAGVAHFLALAEDEGYDSYFLGPAVEVIKLFESINKYKPDIVGISYRLTPENVIVLLDEVERRSKNLGYEPVWVFGGTKHVAKIASNYSMFSYISDGSDDINDSIRFLRGDDKGQEINSYPQSLIERIEANYPYPILRHHFGLPSVDETMDGVKEIAEACVLDVISLGTDQNAQQYFFKQSEMQDKYNGAGGVPIRNEEQFYKIKEASQIGNYPIMRCYSGTEDLFKHAEMLERTINNAWCAIPLSWYSELDGRSKRSIETTILEAQKLIKWHADKNIPVEINEPHHWGLRDAHDVIPVVMAFISAYNAKKLGVKHYISQYMFNNPNGLSFSMDLARVLAMIELVESLEDESFKVYRETRAGLPLFNVDMDIAKGQLSASTFLQMVVKPHIIHVVAFCEAEHIAKSEDVIASCKIVKGVIKHTLGEDYSIANDKKIVKRKEELIKEAKYLIKFISERYSKYEDPLSNAKVLAECIKLGIIDAVHIAKDCKFVGNLSTKFIDGTCVAYNKKTGEVINEKERLDGLNLKTPNI